jgi:hypothetical protein
VFLAAGIYLAANPGFLVNFKDMIDLASHTLGGAAEKSEEYGSVPLEVNLWAFYARAILLSQGPVVTALAVAGGILGLLHRQRDVLLHVVFIVTFFAVIAGSSSSHLYYGRYVLPLLPGICMLAGFALDELVRRVRAPAPLATALGAGLAVVLAIEPLLACIRWDERLARLDTRTQAAEWVESNAPDGARILLEGFPEETAQLAIPLESTPHNMRAMSERLRVTDPGKAMFWDMKLKSWTPPGYDLVTVRHFEDWPTLQAVRAQGVQWIVVRREFFVPGTRHETKFNSSTLTTRYAFYDSLAVCPDARRLAFFDADPAGAPGYDIEIWRVAAPVNGAGS